MTGSTPDAGGADEPVRAQRLYPPGPDEQIDLLAAVGLERRPPPPGRPWVLTNMIASADGATAVQGRSGALGGPADRQMFRALRAVCDAIVVGSQTARAERYGPPRLGSEREQAARAERGQQPRPLLVVVSASLDFDRSLPLFADPDHRPLIATARTADPARRASLAAVADVVDAGDDRVEPAALLAVLAERGIGVALCEGGPSLNGQLIQADAIDEWNLTVAPLLVSGDAARAAHGPPPLAPPGPMTLSRVWLADDLLFCRWVRPSGD